MTDPELLVLPDNQPLSSKEKRKQTVMKRYGVENVAHLPESQIKKKKFNLEKYGVENVNQLEEFRQKARETNLRKYGQEYPSHTEKGIETSLKRYGVRHPMQNFKVFQRVMKARFQVKTYTTKSGKQIKYQGYENVILKFLLEEMEIDESRIVTNRASIPKIFYLNPLTNKMSRYYPDIWIKDSTLLIEVKSKFTLKFNTEITMAKQQACKSLGYQCVIAVCSKRDIIEVIL